MRVKGEREVQLEGGEVGWIHRLNGEVKVKFIPKPEPEVTIDSLRILSHWRDQTTNDRISKLAYSLNLTIPSLIRLGCVWAHEHRAYGFGMKDGYGKYIGIRLRSESGDKWAVKGSHAGIFYPPEPTDAERKRPALICEGPTDTAAALSLGYFAIGRPSCSGGSPHIITALRRLRISQAAIVADNDGPGLSGAQILGDNLPIPHAALVLPCKDLREFIRNGGDGVTLECLMKGTLWERPKQT